jgi:hypothetical protein
MSAAIAAASRLVVRNIDRLHFWCVLARPTGGAGAIAAKQGVSGRGRSGDGAAFRFFKRRQKERQSADQGDGASSHAGRK